MTDATETVPEDTNDVEDAGVDQAEYGQFDDWFGDGEAAGTELQNQAASLDTATKEERTCRGPDDAAKIDTACTGQLVVRFKVNEKNVFKTVSGTIVKQDIDDNYILLTARTNMHYFTEDGRLDCEDGFFFLQKTDKRACKAIFRFEQDAVTHYMKETPFVIDEDTEVSGRNLSGIRLTNVKVEQDLDLPEFDVVESDDFNIDTDFTVAGYPEKILENGALVDMKDKMYSVTGKCKHTRPELLGMDILTSKGQNGGAVTFADTGRVFGIYTDIADHQEFGEKLGIAIRVTDKITEFVETV